MSYEDLKVWQKSMMLVELIYAHVSKFPDDEKYGLVSQMKRAVVSIPSNIAEGRHKNSRPDFRRFLNIAFGSTKELLTQVEIARRLKFLSEQEVILLRNKLNEVSKMLYALIKTLQ